MCCVGSCDTTLPQTHDIDRRVTWEVSQKRAESRRRLSGGDQLLENLVKQFPRGSEPIDSLGRSALYTVVLSQRFEIALHGRSMDVHRLAQLGQGVW